MRRLLMLLVTLSLFALTMPSAHVSKVQGQSPGVDPNKWYNIIAKHSGQCLDVQFGSRADGAKLIQYYCHFGDNQTFRFEPRGDGYYRIITGNAGKCVDQANATLTPGGYFMQYFCHDGQNQQFQLIDGVVGSGLYNQIRVRHSGMNMDVANYSFSPGAQIIQYYPHGADNQQFEFREAPNVPCAGRDADGDGWSACYDCNDNDPSINPGAGINCGAGEDLNCNGQDDYEECYGGGGCCF